MLRLGDYYKGEFDSYRCRGRYIAAYTKMDKRFPWDKDVTYVSIIEQGAHIGNRIPRMTAESCNLNQLHFVILHMALCCIDLAMIQRWKYSVMEGISDCWTPTSPQQSLVNLTIVTGHNIFAVRKPQMTGKSYIPYQTMIRMNHLELS